MFRLHFHSVSVSSIEPEMIGLRNFYIFTKRDCLGSFQFSTKNIGHKQHNLFNVHSVKFMSQSSNWMIVDESLLHNYEKIIRLISIALLFYAETTNFNSSSYLQIKADKHPERDSGKLGNASPETHWNFPIMRFMFYDNNNKSNIDMYTSSGCHDTFGRANGSCQKNITRSALNRWVSESFFFSFPVALSINQMAAIEVSSFCTQTNTHIGSYSCRGRAWIIWELNLWYLTFSTCLLSFFCIIYYLR